MTEFLQLFVIGLATGGFYTINALGFVVIFRSSGIINFAGVASAMTGGYLEWQMADQWHVAKPIAVIGAVLASAVVSLLVYLLAIRPLNRTSTLTRVIATLAALVSLQELITLMFGGLPKTPSAILPGHSVALGSVRVGEDSLIILAVSIALTFGLWAFYRRSRFGLATSALAESPRSLGALGWDIGRLRAANWAIGGALAGLAGAGLGPLLQLTPGIYTALLVPTLAGAMIGGLRSFPWTLAGGLLVGAAQAEAGRYITYSGAADAVPFLLIVAVLVWRGRGRIGRSYVQERLPRVGSGEIPVFKVLAAVAFFAVAALFVKDGWVIGATVTVMTATILLSQLVITGYAGQLSLAQLTLAGVGAIVAANLAAGQHLPFLLAMVVGMAVVVPVSVIVGLPSLRARGVSLAVATLGFAVAINSVILTSPRFAGGLSGLTLSTPTVFGLDVDSTLHPRRYFYVALVVFTLLALVVANMRRGAAGRRLIAVRTNERAAEALGINVTGAKLYAFTLAGVIAAAGGVLLAFNQTVPQFGGFDPLTGLTYLVGSVLGGIGYVGGAIIGGLINNDGLPNAILYPVVGNLNWWTELLPLLTGVIVVVQLIGNPDGIADVIAHGGSGRLKARLAGSAGSGRLASLTTGVTLGGVRLGGGRQARAVRRRDGYMGQLAADRSLHRGHGARLQARDISVRFGVVTAVDAVDIDVAPGEVLAVIGPNGAGKTTLMDAITGFVAMTGTIEIDGRRIEDAPVHLRARAGIARSFQSLELLEDMTVLDNLRCAADPKGNSSLLLDLFHPARGALTSATMAAIVAFSLEDKLDRMPTEIGYGDRRLVAIARALAGDPSVVLLDEPAAGLSDTERVEVARAITMLAREWGIAVLLIEHDVDLVRQVSDRVIALDFGQVIAQGSADDVLAHPEVVRAYLGVSELPEQADSSDDSETPSTHVPVGEDHDLPPVDLEANELIGSNRSSTNPGRSVVRRA